MVRAVAIRPRRAENGHLGRWPERASGVGIKGGDSRTGPARIESPGAAAVPRAPVTAAAQANRPPVRVAIARMGPLVKPSCQMGSRGRSRPIRNRNKVADGPGVAGLVVVSRAGTAGPQSRLTPAQTFRYTPARLAVAAALRHALFFLEGSWWVPIVACRRPGSGSVRRVADRAGLKGASARTRRIYWRLSRACLRAGTGMCAAAGGGSPGQGWPGPSPLVPSTRARRVRPDPGRVGGPRVRERSTAPPPRGPGVPGLVAVCHLWRSWGRGDSSDAG